MNIERPLYIEKLKQLQRNGHCKIIYGMRFCGKTHLLHTFTNSLFQSGVSQSQVLFYEFGNFGLSHLYEGTALLTDILSKLPSDKFGYVILDDFHKIRHPEIVLQGLAKKEHLDLYLSTNCANFSEDVRLKTYFESDYIPLYPISYEEYRNHFHTTGLSEEALWNNYAEFGGLPFVLCKKSAEEKRTALRMLVYNYAIPDLIKRYHIRSEKMLSELIQALAMQLGETKSYLQLSKDISSHDTISSATVKKHIHFLEDAFVISPAKKYNLTTNHCYDSHARFYFMDHGICNACFNFDEAKRPQIISNIIHNELIFHGFSVDTGVVECYTKDSSRKTIRNNILIDFVARKENDCLYIQLAHSDEEYQQKQEALSHIKLPGKKLILTHKKEVRHIP